MIPITKTISIHESELSFEFMRAGGPGGQNVNKVETAVQLRFSIWESPSLPAWLQHRLFKMAQNRITSQGELVLTAHRFRSQDQNRKDVIDRFIHLIRQAAKPQKIRRKTKPTQASKKHRLEQKKHRGKTKQLRRQVSFSEE